MNEACSRNIDNNLNKKWECLHHCWSRWIALSMKKSTLNRKQSVLQGKSNGWWLVNAYQAVVASVCRYKITAGNTVKVSAQNDYEIFYIQSFKWHREEECNTGGWWSCKPVPSGASLHILCARCSICSASHWFSSVAPGPGQRTRNLQRHIRAGPGTQTQNSPWGRRRWLSHTESLGESP